MPDGDVLKTIKYHPKTHTANNVPMEFISLLSMQCVNTIFINSIATMLCDNVLVRRV